MNHQFIITELQKNKDVFHHLLSNQNTEQIFFKPHADKWCLLEVLCHLRDEECDDFRARVNHTLHNPELPMPSIDPVGWVTSRNYMEQEYDTVLKSFLAERVKSIEWLQSLANPQWNNKYMHPKFGDMSAEYFLTNWLAHDYLHIRQITKLKYDYLKHITGQPLNYAGDW